MIIRRMIQADAQTVACIEQENFSQPWSQQGFIDALKEEQMILFVAEEQEIAGYISAIIAADEGEILQVSVSRKYRRQHIAEMLVNEITLRLIERGATTIYLEVRESNRAAIDLYRKKGFEVCGKRPKFYSKPTEDALVMSVRPDITTTKE